MAPRDRVLVLLTMLGGERTMAFAKDDVAIARWLLPQCFPSAVQGKRRRLN
jgi:hypothetical protein